MIDPASGPFLFDTSAETWLARTQIPSAFGWWRQYVSLHPVHISSVTVMERVRGYAAAWRRADGERRRQIELARLSYLTHLGTVWPVNAAIAIVAGEIMALLADPPTPPRRTHRGAESGAERLARWRFDIMIAATALVQRLPLIHNNPADFEAIRGAIERSPERFPNLGPLNLVRCGQLLLFSELF